jgi:hypothetical protein
VRCWTRPRSRSIGCARFVAAVERGLADVAAGRVVDDDDVGRELDEELGPLV